MVCSGNICRSPLAEAVLRSQLDRAGVGARVEVASAGTGALVGMPPDPRAVAAGTRRGYDLTRGRARQVGVADLERFDLVLAMDGRHLEDLQALRPATPRAEIRRLLELAPGPAGELDVPDPYYGPPEGFERALDLIEPACAAWFALLRQRLG